MRNTLILGLIALGQAILYPTDVVSSEVQLVDPSSAYALPDPEFMKALKPLPNLDAVPEAKEVKPSEVSVGPFLESLDGAVALAVRTRNGEVRTAKAGTSLDVGDTFQTSHPASELSASARLIFEEGIQVLISPGSIVRVDEVLMDSAVPVRRVSVLQLVKGEVRALVEPSKGNRFRFVVLTPTSAVGVRGTDFIVSVDAGKSTLHTMNGMVEYAQDLAVLKRGQGVKVGPAKFSEAVEGKRPLPPAVFEVSAFLTEFHQKHLRLEDLWVNARRDVKSPKIQARFRTQRIQNAEMINLKKGILPVRFRRFLPPSTPSPVASAIPSPSPSPSLVPVLETEELEKFESPTELESPSRRRR